MGASRSRSASPAPSGQASPSFLATPSGQPAHPRQNWSRGESPIPGAAFPAASTSPPQEIDVGGWGSGTAPSPPIVPPTTGPINDPSSSPQPDGFGGSASW